MASTAPRTPEAPQALASAAKPRMKEPPHFATAKEFVTVIASGEKFVIHKDFITHRSPFFDRAFNGEFIEGETQTLALPDVSAPIFGLFVQWLYTQQICHPGHEPTPVTLIEFADLWILGGKWLAPKLQNKVMDMFPSIENASEEDIKALVQKAYSSGERTMLQKRVAMELVLVSFNRKVVDQWLPDMPPALALDFATNLHAWFSGCAYTDRERARMSCWKKGSFYYVHEV